MEKLTVSYHNTQTDEVIVREMTAEEIASHDLIISEREEDRKKELERANTKATLLSRLGITAEEAQLLLGGN